MTQGKLFALFRRSCPWKINIFCYIGKKPLPVGMPAKICEDLGGFSLEDFYKWILVSFWLRYHFRKQISHIVATKALWSIFKVGVQLPQG